MTTEATSGVAELRSDPVLPPSDSALIKQAEAFLAEHTHAAALEADGARVELPDEVFRVLVNVVGAMSRGDAVTVAPVSMRLTTSQAAEILGISRPTLIRLLAEGALPYEQPRRHRLLRLDDVLSYKHRRRVETRMALNEMTRQAAADGLYDDTAELYTEPLRQARRGQI